MDCNKEAVFEGIDVDFGEVRYCQEHLDKETVRRTGVKWDDLTDD